MSSDDDRANQMNPNNDAYWQSRGYDDQPDDWYDDNRANQMNRNNDAYWQARGEPERPDDWDQQDD